MIASVIYLALRRLMELLVLRRRLDDGKELEILVLCQELMVLRRQVARPRCTLADRVVLSALGQVLPRDRRGSLFVRPETVRRWHRVLIARRWRYRRATSGWPRTGASIRELVLRLAHESPTGYIHQPPDPANQTSRARIQRRDRLDGLLHEFYRAAA